ncbi:MAG TPA: hypothetical protein VMU89_14770 [Thermomicrobiaceae bacterium]|nr:hypothetical protein [Thermomicrobiaceae bacterium]
MPSTIYSVSPPRLATKADLKVIDTQVAVTGTAAVAVGNGFGTVLAQSAQATVANAATTVPTASASVTSVSGTTINVVVVAQAAAANTISAVAQNVNVHAVGY